MRMISVESAGVLGFSSAAMARVEKTTAWTALASGPPSMSLTGSGSVTLALVPAAPAGAQQTGDRLQRSARERMRCLFSSASRGTSADNLLPPRRGAAAEQRSCRTSARKRAKRASALPST